MLPVQPHPGAAPVGRRRGTFVLGALLSALVCLAPGAVVAAPQASPEKIEILPLNQVKPGMRGYARTIFAGDQMEQFDLEVLGVIPNMMGPKQDIILVRLLGPRVEYTGVVAGMSGSPVYLAGKLAGALSLKLGIFTKEAIAGVTPIESVLDAGAAAGGSGTATASSAAPLQFPAPPDVAERIGLGAGAYFTPIETPLIFSGFGPEVLRRYAADFAAYGLVAAPGGTVAAQPDDAQVKPGDMVSMVLLQGDLSISGACTVTAVTDDRVYACGHPVFGFGTVALPMARGRVITTLPSQMASTKIVNAGGIIGTITQDRVTAILGRLGPAPRMIPMEMTVATPGREKEFRFELMENARLTPLLVGLAAFNGLVANTVYNEGTTLRLTGEIRIAGHSSVTLENMFAPGDSPVPDGMLVAVNVQSVFSRVFSNPYETPNIERIRLRLESIPERRLAAIESAWSEKSEAQPGETMSVKVLLRPYRGAPVIQDVPFTIPAQVARGTTLRLLVSDADMLNRTTRLLTFAPQGRLAGLEQLITLLNRERRNNRLYVTLLQPTPTLLVEDKELPNAPLSELNVLDQRRSSGTSLLLRESTVGEWSVPMNQVISGFYSVTITVK